MTYLPFRDRLSILVQQPDSITRYRLSGTARFDLTKTIGKKDMTDLCGTGAIQDLHSKFFLEAVINLHRQDLSR